MNKLLFYIVHLRFEYLSMEEWEIIGKINMYICFVLFYGIANSHKNNFMTITVLV